MTNLANLNAAETSDERELLIGDERSPTNRRIDSEMRTNNLLGRMFSHLRKLSSNVEAHQATNENYPQIRVNLNPNSSAHLTNSCTDLDEDEHLNVSTRLNKNNLNVLGSQFSSRGQQKRSSKTPHYANKSTITPLSGRQFRLIFTLIALLLLLLGSIVLLLKLLSLLEEHREASQVYSNQESIISQLNSNKQKHQSDHLNHSAIDNIQVDREQLRESQQSRWLVSSPKCHIPVIDPWHESITDYVKVKPALQCDKIAQDNETMPSLTYTKGNWLLFTPQAIKQKAPKECCYRSITRSLDNDDDLIYNETCNTMLDASDGLLIETFELIKVECQHLNYNNVHSFTQHNRDEEESLKRVAARRLDQDHYYNIVMLGVDTISRLNGHRQLKKTLNFLREKYHTLEFTGYNKVGENTFPNLIPLLTGLKDTQLTETQCWLASNYSQESETGDDYLDNCKYLWNFYQEFGYLTYFSEDWPKASTFNYLKMGFKHEPTSRYLRPFTIARDHLLLPPVKMGCASCLLDKPLVEVDLKNLEQFIDQNQNNPYFAFHWINCPQHDDLNGASQVDHIIEKFFGNIEKLTHKDRTFVFFFSDHGYRWNDFVSTRVGHYESSLPLLTIAVPERFKTEHPDLYENLRRHQSALLTPFDLFKTIIDIRDLGEGHTNSSKAHVIKRRKAISKTTKRPLNGTMLESDLGYTTGPTASTTTQQLKMQDGLSYKQEFKTLSLLKRHSDTELDRSCIDAGIPDNYCVCHEYERVDVVKNTDALGAAYFLVYAHLYSRLENHQRICHPLDLEKVHQAEVFDLARMNVNTSTRRRRRRQVEEETLVGDSDDESRENHYTTTPSTMIANPTTIDEGHYLPNREYNVRLSTKPGSALFQEVVRFYGSDIDLCKTRIEKTRLVIEDKSKSPKSKHEEVMSMNKVCKFSIHSDSISRLNLYKDQSKCVKSNIELKKICYCK